MGLISRLFNFTAGTVIDSEQVDAEFDQIHGVLNGNVESANLKDGTISLADLATAVKNNFPKLAVSADRKENFGSYVEPAGWGGGSSHTGTIPHGLGATPVNVQLTAHAMDTSSGTGTVIDASIISSDSTNISYKVASVDGSTAAIGTVVDWRAVA